MQRIKDVFFIHSLTQLSKVMPLFPPKSHNDHAVAEDMPHPYSLVSMTTNSNKCFNLENHTDGVNANNVDPNCNCQYCPILMIDDANKNIDWR